LSALADRIREIVSAGTRSSGLTVPARTTPAAQPALPAPPNPSARPAPPALQAALGGEWRAGCFVVDRRVDPSVRHGREAIGEVAERLEHASDEARLFTSGAPAKPPFVFFDLETTGLSGGAGTLAFLVGCGWFEFDGGFLTRQFLLTRFADERPLLEAVAAELGRAGALVSFNGKSFDAPLLETRFLFHRLAWIGALPHVDVLHPARRFWRSHVALQEQRSCSLSALEREIVGTRRTGDVPGFEIPGRYFQFVRSGDAAPLKAVLAHNRLDLLTLASLAARLLHLTRTGPTGARDAREALALGHVYARAGFENRARAAYRHAIDRCLSPQGAYDPIRIEALRMLAVTYRRAREFQNAAACWSELLDVRGCPAAFEREAAIALAVHHEHRDRNLALAKRFALGSLTTVNAGLRPALVQAVQHRLARIERKMGVSRSHGGLLD
jgi:uncharacterized protein YprB with RNaseH-like and TPR domain